MGGIDRSQRRRRERQERMVVEFIKRGRMMMIDARYLGDGVYASFDGEIIWLSFGQDNTTKIALEPSVFSGLIQFRDDIYKKLNVSFYAGSRTDGNIVVTRDGNAFDPVPSQELHNHSPDGFNWGYIGSGAAQLALALLLDAGIEEPLKLHQKFKVAKVAQWGDTWKISTDEIQEWVQTARSGD